MRYSKKQGVPLLFQRWRTENDAAIQSWVNNTSKTGGDLWEQLGKTFDIERITDINPNDVRHDLEDALFAEQNGLCCYCGNQLLRKWNFNDKIWEYHLHAIEHFEPKNIFKNKTFDYDNLMLCCKESQRLIPYEIGKIQSGKLIASFEDVAKITDISIEKIKIHPRNQALLNKKLAVGDKIFYPNPPHCDDAKSKYDSKKPQITIINPSKNEDLIEKLQFSNNGMIENPYKELVIKDTFKVLALNCDTLIDRRKAVWSNAELNYLLIEEALLESGADEFTLKSLISNQLPKLIVGKSTPDEDGLLESFYFVEVAFLQSLFNGK
jgi:uncharacterized protein (TIGR02646 family)